MSTSKEKGFRELNCHGCTMRIKFPVTTEQYGKSIQAKCPCGAINRATIPVPAVVEVPPAPAAPAWPFMNMADTAPPAGSESLQDFFGNFFDGHITFHFSVIQIQVS